MVTENLKIENARIIFRNFRGEATKFNREGNRNFSVVIDDPEMAEKLKADGWNVKYLEAREEGDERTAYINVKVAFSDYNAVNVFKVTSANTVRLDENSIACLDYADIKSADIIIRPYNWEVGGASGVSAYVKTMYVVLDEDEFAAKYSKDEVPFM